MGGEASNAGLGSPTLLPASSTEDWAYRREGKASGASLISPAPLPSNDAEDEKWGRGWTWGDAEL